MMDLRYLSYPNCWAGTQSVPPDGGTIMSYCHLRTGGTENNINSYLGRAGFYGTNSERVNMLIRQHIEDRQAATSCLTEVNEPCPTGLVRSNETLSGVQTLEATSIATLGPDLTIDATDIVVNSELVSFISNNVIIGGTFQAGNTPICTPPENKIIFATSTAFNGDLNGFFGADQKCQASAAIAGLTGGYNAWLSTDTVDAKDRIGDYTYTNIDGTVVANNKTELLSCTNGGTECLQNRIRDENGNEAFDPDVWTGTNEDGTRNANTCSNWTTTSGQGVIGDLGTKFWGWTNAAGRSCSESFRLYCVQN